MPKFTSIFLAVILGFSTISSAEDRFREIKRLSDSCRYYIDTQQFNRSVKFARQLVSFTDDMRPGMPKLAAMAYAGQSYMAADMYDSAGIILNKGLELWYQISHSKISRKHDFNWMPVFIIYNSLGIYYITYRMDYRKAIETFISGMELIDQHSNGDEACIMGYNLMMAYFIRKDTLGIKYARTLYEKGQNNPKCRMYFIGAYGLAKMYYLKNDFEKSRKFLDQAADNPFRTMDPVGIHNLYADIFARTGKTDDAKNEYDKAFRLINKDIPATNSSYLYLSYGDFLCSLGRYSEAVNILRHGLDIAEIKENKVFTYNLYHSLSSTYDMMGCQDSALFYYKKFHATSDSLFNIKEERAIRELTLKNEETRHMAEIQEKTKSIYILSIIVISILIISYILWKMYRYKDRMYTILARKYNDTLKKGRVNDNDSIMLFMKIEKLMQEDKIYKDSSISIEKAAASIGSNRTYLSQCINKNTGKSFRQYVNGYRIHEALTLLSDLEHDMPVKAIAVDSGFCSFSTFAKLFKEEVGMSPSVYREKIRSIRKIEHKTAPETAN